MAASTSLYLATIAGRQEVYNAYLAAGKGTPFIYPWDSLPALYLFLGIIIRPYLSRQLARISGYVIFSIVVAHSTYIVANRRCLGFAAGYGIGLATIWGTIMTGVWLLIHEPDKDYARLEIWKGAAATTYTQSSSGVSYSIDKDDLAQQSATRRGDKFTQSFDPKKSGVSKHGTPYRLVWQPYPKGDALHCIDWTIDFMTSFRGPNWNFRIPTLPKIKTIPPPPNYEITKAIEGSMLANETENPSNPSSESIVRKFVLSTAKWYLLVDMIKVIMISDPYFLGLRPLSSPTPWPFLQNHALLTKLARLLTSLAGVQIWLSLIFSLSPFCFYTVLPRLVSQASLIKITRAPLYDPRMYTPLYSPALPNIATTGLAGFWGKYWHQMFRYGISEPSKPLVKALNLSPRSDLSRAIQLLVAFSLTGTIHAVAAASTFSIIPSKPENAFLFFFSQGIGIIIQTALAKVLVQQLGLKGSTGIRKAGNLAFVLVWLWVTAPLLVNDFARAGIWLFEPVPISFTRGLMGQGWWVWKGQWLGIWKGTAWWNSGIAVY